MAVMLRPQSHGRKDCCYKRITEPRSRVWSDQEVARPHGLSESTSLGKHHWPPGRERWAAAFGAQGSPRSQLWQRQVAPGPRPPPGEHRDAGKGEGPGQHGSRHFLCLLCPVLRGSSPPTTRDRGPVPPLRPGTTRGSAALGVRVEKSTVKREVS